MTIAVVGATGNTGRAVVKELRQLGEEPLCVVRNAEKARDVLGANARTAIAELMDRAALAEALSGVDSVFLVTGHNPQMADQQGNVIDAAAQAGVAHLVRLSSGRAVAATDSPTLIGRAHHAIDEKMRGGRIGWTILRPGLFMQNFLAQAPLIKSESKIVMPYAADFPLAPVDVRDTGAVAARILLAPAAHAGKTYEFTGALTNCAELAETFSQALGRKISYVEISVEQNEQAMKARGMPDWLVAHLIGIARIGRAGGFSTANTQPIRDIAKRAPLTTRQFVEDHKGAFS